MLLTVLSVPGCPNANVLVDRIEVALAGRPAEVDVVVVDELEGALRWGMTGSPTLLVDGADPFPTAATEPSLSCRLHRARDGSLSGAPSVAELDAVFARGTSGTPRVGVESVDAVGRGGRGRLAPVEHGLRAVQRAALRAVAETGFLPALVALDKAAEPFGRSGAEVLLDLATEDFLTLDQHGQIAALYPFSLPESRHRVDVAGGPQVWAMCAIDALGIPAMLDRAVSIETTDPISSEPITVEVDPDGAVHAPADHPTVFVGRRADSGPAEKTCCDLINFFASPHSAARWMALHREVPGELLDLPAAVALGRKIFGALLRDG